MNGKDRQRAIRELRGYMWSPGRPSTARREDRVRFWEAIARGVSTEDAAAVAGVSSAVGARWFRQAGGMPSVSMQPTTNRFLSFAEREEIAILVEQKLGVREIARRVHRSPSTISRELRRNASTRAYGAPYRASTAQWHAERRASRPKVSKLAANDRLREYVQDRLAGAIARPMASLCLALLCVSLGDVTADELTGDGPGRGAPSRSRTGSASTSPMMGPCGSRMRRSIRRCTCKAVALCVAS